MNMIIARRQRGLSLLEFTVVLSLLAGAAFLLMPTREEAPSFLHEEIVLDVVDQQLIYFIATNSRLPCPDYSGNGWEDCAGGTGKGGLPYRTLGMNRGNYGLADMPILYGVYSNSNTQWVQDPEGNTVFGNDADLSASRNRFEPTMADGVFVSMDNAAAPDFCTALEAARLNPYSASHTYVQEQTQPYNVAYAIASPGRYDSDGNGSLFDGINETDDHGFHSDNTSVRGDYDDRVRSRTFAELSARLECDSLIQSLNLIANGRQTEIEVSDTLDGNIESTAIGAAINGVGISLNVVDVVQASFNVINAAIALTAAVTALAAAISSCFALVGCAGIPGAAAAVAAATAAIAASSLSVAAAATATAAQVVTTALYITAAVQMSLTDLEFEALDDLDDVDTAGALRDSRSEVEDDLAELEDDLDLARAERDAARQQMNNNRTQIESYMQNNGGTDPEVVQRLDTLESEAEALSQAALTLQDKEAAYEDAVVQCDALENDDRPEGLSDIEGADDIELSCDQSVVDEAESEFNDAQAAYQSQQQQRDDAAAAARTAANNYQVYQGTDDDDEPIYTACSEVSGCNMASYVGQVIETDPLTFDGFVGGAEEYYARQFEVAALEAQFDSQQQALIGIDESIAAAECRNQGDVYDPDTGGCVPPGEQGSADAIQTTSGALNILEVVDGFHLMGQQ